MTTVIAGFGNELRADDGVGLAVIRHLERAGVPGGVRCAEVGSGGIAMLHELFAGCERLVVVDAVRRGGAPGTVYVLTPRFGPDAGHDALVDAHFTEPYAALTLARALGVLPGEIHVVGVEVAETEELSLELTPAVLRAVPIAAERALALATAQRPSSSWAGPGAPPGPAQPSWAGPGSLRFPVSDPSAEGTPDTAAQRPQVPPGRTVVVAGPRDDGGGR